MNRYRMTAYYEDHNTTARVAQEVVVIERDARSAVDAVANKLGPRAIGRHIAVIEITERQDIETGVVYVGEPYIPIHWPLVNRPRQVPNGARPRAAPAPPEKPEPGPPTGGFAGHPRRAEFPAPTDVGITSDAG
ncbi:MAG TPA: hypothetical protein VNE39_14170 [Planctomycetota bacterium]|nr:hypothetical protein [Planctomycetota bacterium]